MGGYRTEKPSFLPKTKFLQPCEKFEYLFWRQNIFKYQQCIDHFEDLDETNRIEKTRTQNINFERSYGHLKNAHKKSGPKWVFGLQ